MENINEKQNLLCKEAVYVSSTGGACSRLGAISKKNVTLLGVLASVIPRLSMKR